MATQTNKPQKINRIGKKNKSSDKGIFSWDYPFVFSGDAGFRGVGSNGKKTK